MHLSRISQEENLKEKINLILEVFKEHNPIIQSSGWLNQVILPIHWLNSWDVENRETKHVIHVDICKLTKFKWNSGAGGRYAEEIYLKTNMRHFYVV